MRISILFGTESGNAEMTAEDLADALGTEHEVEVLDMALVDPGELDLDTLHLIVCSTYGDGELPCGAYPFVRALNRHRPDLTGLRFAMFGLGDSTYQRTYSQGSEIVDRELAACGAVRVGEYGRHDAEEDGDPGECAQAWVTGVLACLSSVAA